MLTREEWKTEFCKRINEMKDEKGLEARDFSNRIPFYSECVFRSYFRGVSVPNAYVAIQMAKVFGCPVTDLMGCERYWFNPRDYDESQWIRHFSRTFKRIFMKSRMTKTELSKKSGVSYALLMKLFEEKSMPSVYDIYRLSNGLGCTIQSLMEFE